MRLLVTTPTEVIADHGDVVSLVAEDASGSFGILPGHADFVTVLSPSVVSWRHEDGGMGHCAVRRGVLGIDGGTTLSIATREAVLSTDLERLESGVLARFHASAEEERAARLEAVALRMKAIRRIIHYLRAPGANRLETLT
jgi:F-type H+-transporting ATPase subunit epsilon